MEAPVGGMARVTGRGSVKRDAATDVFAVIAHPLRRALLDLLQAAPGQEQSVKRLAASFEVTRPAISQHLAVLLAAGLVTERKVGRERRYRLQGDRLREVYGWLGRYARCWEAG
jgi:DNA-binding transcriptional ArsR family regulator